MLGSESRLGDSDYVDWADGGVTLNSASVDATGEGCQFVTMAGSQLSRDSVLLLLEEWR